MSKPQNLVVIHLSATAVYVVIGHVISADDIQIMGIGEIKSEDFQQGKIKNRERLRGAIRQAITQAEEMANCRVHSAWLTFSTPELFSTNGSGQVSLSEGVVETQHIVKALTYAKAANMPSTDYYLMHHCQQGISVDGQQQMVDDAIDMYAKDIDVMYHLMMMPVASRQNIQNLIQDCDIRIDHMLFDAVSTAEYGLIEEERAQGVCLIDIGASTTSICVYYDNRLVFTKCFKEGGHQVTMDISAELDISMADAERLKKIAGTVDTENIDAGEFITHKCVGVAGEVTVSALQLSEIIEARYQLLLESIKQTLIAEDLNDFLQRGFVLAGRGSLINGIIPFARRTLDKPVFMTNTHEAISAYRGSDDNRYSHLEAKIQERTLQTAFGALLYSQSDQFRYSEKSSSDALKVSTFKRVRQSIDGFFKRFI